MYAAGLALAYVLVWWLVPAPYDALAGGLVLVGALALLEAECRFGRGCLARRLLRHDDRLSDLEASTLTLRDHDAP